MHPTLASHVLISLCVASEPAAPLAPVEVGTGLPYDFTPDLSSATPSDGRLFFATLIELPGSSFVKPHFVDLHLAPGDVLTVRSRSGQVVETLTERGPGARGTFWGLSAFGPELVLEFDFAAPYSRPPFRIDQLIRGNDKLYAAIQPKSLCPPEDFDDVICYQNDAAKWANVVASAGVMTVSGNPIAGALWCSGSNISPLNYVLTNFHCIGTQLGCANSEFVFRYWRTQCNNGAQPTQDWVGFHCNQMVVNSPLGDCEATTSTLDFSLNSVIGDPAAQFGFVQPDTTPLADGDAIYIVQHPAGRPHEITHGAGANVDVSGSNLRYYGTLDTEGGSSGSPIFRESDDKLVGLHHCGGCTTAGTGNRGMLMTDIHPHVASYVCTPALALTVKDATPFTQVYGNDDPFLDPGETWDFRLRITNTSCAIDAHAVATSVSLAPGSAAATLLQPLASFGTIAHGATVTQSDAIRFTIDPAATCGATLAFDVAALTTTSGGPFPGKPNVASAAIGNGGSTTLFYSDFDEDVSPWLVVDGGQAQGGDHTWAVSADPKVPLTALFAICDSSLAGSPVMDEQLVSPSVDTTGWQTVHVQFRHDFNWFPGSLAEKAEVDVRSAKTGGQWTNVASFANADANGVVSIDVSPHAENVTDLQVRFHYSNASFERWWAIDEVFVIGSGPPCDSDALPTYGNGCATPSGTKPRLDASGSATPGGLLAIEVTNAVPSTAGALFISSQPATLGCLLLQPPLLGPYPLPVGSQGTAQLVATVPPTLPPSVTARLQWFGVNGSASNGLVVAVH